MTATEHLTVTELADELGVPTETVRTYLIQLIVMDGRALHVESTHRSGDHVLSYYGAEGIRQAVTAGRECGDI